jgi:hypothetical protein
MYRYCYLPSGNSYEFPELEDEMLRRGIELEYSYLHHGGGRVYRLKETDLDKLPIDKEGPFFGDSDSGHSLTKNGEFFRSSFNGGPWTKI